MPIVILLLAAGLKAATPPLGDGLLHNWLFNVFVVAFELFCGVWLVFGLLPRLTWWVVVGLFLVFWIVSFYKTISGAATCGCWGNVEIPPVYTALLDTLVIGLLWNFRPINTVFCFQSLVDEFLFFKKFQLRKLSLVVLARFVVIIPITYAMFFDLHETYNDHKRLACRHVRFIIMSICIDNDKIIYSRYYRQYMIVFFLGDYKMIEYSKIFFQSANDKYHFSYSVLFSIVTVTIRHCRRCFYSINDV
ncbi:MAG: hypothetical protein LBF88_01550 [Planctomycetaceae bacterium]|nr:hypothetical protein [Planctomycetaceae bacterium]